MEAVHEAVAASPCEEPPLPPYPDISDLSVTGKKLEKMAILGLFLKDLSSWILSILTHFGGHLRFVLEKMAILGKEKSAIDGIVTKKI